VNTLALNSDYLIRTGAFDPKDASLVKTEAVYSSRSILKIFNRKNNNLAKAVLYFRFSAERNGLAEIQEDIREYFKSRI
jgi:hypothetical protein